jgi:hypothetical protein
MRGSRRNVLRGVGLAALGTTAVVAPASSAQASPQKATSPGWHVAEVIAVRDGSVLVRGSREWLMVEGFPDGWQILVGDNVAVAASLAGKGLAAGPLTHWISVVAAPSELKPGQALNGTNGPRVVEATILSTELESQRRTGTLTQRNLRVSVAERAAPDGLERIFAIREV